MAEIQNIATQREIRLALGLGPQQAPTAATPVVNVNPKDYREVNLVKTQAVSASGAATVFTSSTSRDTYITSICMSVTKSATCDVSTSQMLISAVIGGNTYYIGALGLLTLTAQDLAVNITCPPIKIDPGTAVTIVSNTFTAGTMVRSCNILGFEVDPFQNNM